MTDAADRLRGLCWQDEWDGVENDMLCAIMAAALREGARLAVANDLLGRMTPTERNAARKAVRRLAKRLKALADELDPEGK